MTDIKAKEMAGKPYIGKAFATKSIKIEIDFSKMHIASGAFSRCGNGSASINESASITIDSNGFQVATEEISTMGAFDQGTIGMNFLAGAAMHVIAPPPPETPPGDIPPPPPPPPPPNNGGKLPGGGASAAATANGGSIDSVGTPTATSDSGVNTGPDNSGGTTW